MPPKHQTKLQLFLNNLWWTFLDGLFTILPITLTIALFSFSLHLLKNWLQPLNNIIEKTILIDVPHSEIILMLAFVLLVGVIMRVFVLRRIVHMLEHVVVQIPLVRPIYSGIKQLVDAFSVQEKVTFKQVVMVEFPRKGVYSIGFLTSELPQELAPSPTTPCFNVFIPTTPNPTSGYFVILPQSEIISVNLSRQEAMALVISGGIILPERFTDK